MASINLLLTVFLVLVSLYVPSVYSLSTRDVVSKQDDESHLMAMSDQGSSMIEVEDLAKARSLQALVAGSKVVVNKKSSSSSSKSSKTKTKKKKNKSKKAGSVGTVIGLIVLIIIVITFTIAIIRLLYVLYEEREVKKAIAHEKIKRSSVTQSPKTEDHV